MYEQNRRVPTSALVAAAVLMAATALVAAVWGGLTRMGLTDPAAPAALVVGHGPLIAHGFFGTVIALERAVALDRRPFFAIPLLSGAGSWLYVAGWPLVGSLTVAAAALGLTLLFGLLTLRHTATHHVVMGAGALAWAVAAGLLVGQTVGFGLATADVTPWWAAFLILTIAGERLELARVLQLDGRQRALFLAAVTLFLGGFGVDLAGLDPGARVAGIGLVGLAAWLTLWDVARRTAGAGGLTGYIGRVLLSGYAWLGVAGGLLVWFGPQAAGLHYDAQWHAIFVGFVLAMIFAHAPVVLRSFTGRTIAYHPLFYAAPLLLHLSLAARLAGDLTGQPTLRLAGGLGNAAAIALFAAVALWRLE